MIVHDGADKSVREKLNQLTGLPEGYTPNLQSKWALLEASLEAEQHSKRRGFWMLRAAAVLFLFSVSAVMYFYLHRTAPMANPLQARSSVTPAPVPARQPVAPSIVQVVAQRPAPRPVRAVEQNTPLPQVEQPVINGVVPQTEVEAILATTEATIAVTKKKNKVRYEQMDFGNTVVTTGTLAQQIPPAKTFQIKLLSTDASYKADNKTATSPATFRIHF